MRRCGADAGFAQARYYLALALFDLGQRDEAIGELEQVVAAGAAAGRSLSESGHRVSGRRAVPTPHWRSSTRRSRSIRASRRPHPAGPRLSSQEPYRPGRAGTAARRAQGLQRGVVRLRAAARRFRSRAGNRAAAAAAGPSGGSGDGAEEGARHGSGPRPRQPGDGPGVDLGRAPTTRPPTTRRGPRRPARRSLRPIARGSPPGRSREMTGTA